jgi:hypothetical protein
MGEFRRFIIGLVQALQIVLILGATVGGGLYGWLILQTTGYSPYGWQIAGRPAVEVLFPLVGASIGFLVSATGAVLIFMLAEISANTRTTAVMLEELAGARRTANRDRMR